VNRRSRSIDDDYRQGGRKSGTASPNEIPNNDFQAWEMAIDTFANPEDVTINIFATPGINWADHTVLVQNTIEMIEEQRTDTLYVIDSPELSDIGVATIGGGGNEDVRAATEIIDTLTETGIDSNYSCTYFPWIQIRDTQNNVNVYIPPTGEVVKAMAFTDNTRFPWFAPAGLTRGVTNARKSMYKLSLEARDILYAGRINPMADFADTGTAIFGNKTLQVRNSALDRINVRRLLLQIKVLISNIAVRLLFEQNDQATIDSFLTQANPILDSIKRERGLTDFRIKMDNSNNTPETRDRNELYGEIFLKPTRALEFIGITFTITPSGASFDDVGA
jgi:phage tail sheath protein FI